MERVLTSSIAGSLFSACGRFYDRIVLAFLAPSALLDERFFSIRSFHRTVRIVDLCHVGTLYLALQQNKGEPLASGSLSHRHQCYVFLHSVCFSRGGCFQAFSLLFSWSFRNFSGDFGCGLRKEFREEDRVNRPGDAVYDQAERSISDPAGVVCAGFRV